MKDILKQLNLNGVPVSSANRNSLVPNNSGATMMGSATNNVGLASMIKSAAEAWAATNPGADTTPTIIVEHDGPTITTVDFGNNLPAGQSSPPEDDEVSTFYTEENEETESEGSNEAKRIARLRDKHQHPFEHRTHSRQVQADSPSEFYLDHPPEIRPHGKKARTSDLGNDALQEYLSDQRVVENQAGYPDSINAIKEQTNSERDRAQTSAQRQRSASSSSDSQLERLIQELKRLNKKRDDSKRDSDEGKRLRGAASEDYEDLASNEDEDDEQIRAVRRKLLARLRNKSERNWNKRGSTFQDDAIKIPLHTLLLAALDRRMSPSEQSQTVMQDLIVDERNKGVVAAAQNDFGDPTSALGSLMDKNSLLDSLIQNQIQSVQNATENPFDSHLQDRIGLNSSQVSERDLFAPENLAFNRLQNLLISRQANESSPPKEQSADEKVQNSTRVDERQEEPALAATTRMPASLRLDFTSEKTHQTKTQESTKGRRDLGEDEEQGDFDVNKQVNDFSEDKHDPSLEPTWISKRGERSRSRKRADSPVEFDDDSEESARSKRKRVLKRRRLPPKPEEAEAEAEADSERTEDGFFDKLKRETTVKADVDKSIAGIEGDRSEGRPQRRLVERKRDDEQDGDEESEEREQSAEEGDAPRVKAEDAAKDGAERDGSESKANASTWKAQLIDEEVRKIEELAKRRRSERGRNRGDESADYPGSADDRAEGGRGQTFEDTSESRENGASIRPDSVLQLTIDEKDAQAKITQHYTESAPAG